jgi:2-polyprenyl-3-methyl-5-hydroxy-6-metoxy-1,4-benzoquinol methylase
MNIQKKLTECPVCENKDFLYLKGYQKLYLMKCTNCAFVFDQRIPTSKELHNCYSGYTYSDLRPISNETLNSFNELLDYFEQYRDLGNILDLSCGQGDFLAEARKRNWNVFGSEYSEAAIELCEQRGIAMHQGDLTKDIFNNTKFDVITSFEVIEHINNPNEFMSLTNHKLQRNGVVYCTTPNFNSLLRYFEKDRFMMINYPEHVSYYTKNSIRYLGRKNNFKALKIKTTGLDIGRMTSSPKSNTNEDITAYRINNDRVSENVRKIASSNLMGSFVKAVINYLLTIFGKGDTLKVFWIKSKYLNK